MAVSMSGMLIVGIVCLVVLLVAAVGAVVVFAIVRNQKDR
jgi:hypothetical protein